jgi:hypothetical protein
LDARDFELMALDRSVVHRNLDSKVKIMGMELFDIITVGAFASTMNLLFRETPMAALMVFGLPVLLSLVIYFGKKGKPDRYLQDLIRFSIFPGVFCVGEELNDELLRRKSVVTKSQ